MSSKAAETAALLSWVGRKIYYPPQKIHGEVIKDEGEYVQVSWAEDNPDDPLSTERKNNLFFDDASGVWFLRYH